MLCKPSRDKDSRKSRAFYANQVVTRIHANQGHCYAKPSRDEDSRKPRAFMQIGQIYMEIRISSLYGIARERKEKEQSEKMDKDRTTDKNSTDNKKAYQVTPTPVPHPSGGQPTPPPPSPPLHSLSTSTHATGPQRLAHTRSLLGPHTAGGSFSVLQPCESHVVLTLVVIPRLPCLFARCHLTHRPIPHSVAGPMPSS